LLSRIKSAQMETQTENLQEKFQNLEYKFQKLQEFTEQKTVDDFCKEFKKNAQKVLKLVKFSRTLIYFLVFQ